MNRQQIINALRQTELDMSQAQSIVEIAELEIKHAALVEEYRGLPSVTLSGQSTDPQLN